MIGRNRVVITGIGVLAANGIGKDAFWNSLLAGESGIGPITLFDPSELPCQIAGEVKNFNPLDFMEASMKPRRMGRFSQFAISATALAIKDAGIDRALLKEHKGIPVVSGVSTSDFDTILDKPKAYSTPSLIPHASASSAAMSLQLDCNLITFSNACTSGLDAIAHAAGLIQSSKCEIAIAGGTDSSITKKSMEFLNRGNMLPINMNHSPESASCPFDLNRNGGILAEGSAIVILESEEHAIERGARIYAEVLGSGSRTDLSNTSKEPALCKSMSQALANSSLQISDIDFISAHAPSDKHLDAMETYAIKKVFQNHSHKIPVTSIKGATGNPLGAGGCMQLASTALTIFNETIPPTVNYRVKDPDCDLDYVYAKPRAFQIRHAMINSRGVSGNNSSLVLKRFV